MRAVLAILVAMALPMASVPSAADATSESRPYVATDLRACNIVDLPWQLGASQGIAVPATSPAHDVPLTACFPLDGTEATVSIEVADDLASSVMAFYVFQLSDPLVSARGHFCDAIDDLVIPDGSVRLEVMVSEDQDGRCEPTGPGGTTGIVTVTFGSA